jgi:hypothetical protein
MLLIRPAVRTDVHLLKTLIHEMGEHERSPVLITEEALAHDGVGPRARAPTTGTRLPSYGPKLE